jgi:hypothetical protein
MSENPEKAEKAEEKKWGRIGELGPAWISAIAGLIVALTGAGFIVGHASASSGTASSGIRQTVSPTPSVAAVPAIHINNPVGGDSINMRPVITGTVTGLSADEVVWSFNEPYTTGNSPAPSGMVYPDAGPCRIDGSSFRCNLTFAGAPQDYCRQVQLWVAVVTADEANDDANIKAGVTGNTYISLSTNPTPSHVANAVDRVHVQRDSQPGKSC